MALTKDWEVKLAEIRAKENLTTSGNIKNKSIVNPVLLDKRIERVFRFWRSCEFPYYDMTDSFRQEKFDAFMKIYDDTCLDFNNRAFTFNNGGLALSWSYHPDAWSVPCNDSKSPFDAWNDDELMKKGIKKILTGSFFDKKPIEQLMKYDSITKGAMRGMLRRISGSQMVSNFRPTTASMLYKLFTDEGDVVWDPSCGWSGRLLGAIKSNINYIGTDPSTSALKGSDEMMRTFGNKGSSYKLHCCGSEERIVDKNSLDFVFTSPPYFGTEKYSDEPTQSYLKFNNIESWKEGFLRKTLENAYYGLKPNKFCAINVADVKSYDTFETDTKQIAKEVGFKYVDEFDYVMGSQQASSKSEPIFIFKKGI